MQNSFSKMTTEQVLASINKANNPLVAAANPLLNMIPVIRNQVTQQAPEKLRQKLINDIRHFEIRGQQEGLPYDVLIGARYCLCTSLDEAAMLTPWGKNTVWSSNGLLVTFHNEGWGGEKFFQILARLSKQPQKNILLLELMNYCLLLGFEGRYHIIDNGYSQLETLKQRLAQIIHSVRGDYPTALSPFPTDAPVEQKKWRPMLPIWICAAFLGVLFCLWFIILNWKLTDKTSPVVSSIYQIELPQVFSKDILMQLDLYPALSMLRSRLQDDIDENRLTIRSEGNSTIIITLVGDGLFGSAETAIQRNYQPTLLRVADALNRLNGDITVTGYTDSDKINNARFPSNYELSLARAGSVSTMLKAYLGQPERVSTEGKGELNPLMPNVNNTYKALNRRVEITIHQSPNSHQRTIMRTLPVGDN